MEGADGNGRADRWVCKRCGATNGDESDDSKPRMVAPKTGDHRLIVNLVGAIATHRDQLGALQTRLESVYRLHGSLGRDDQLLLLAKLAAECTEMIDVISTFREGLTAKKTEFP